MKTNLDRVSSKLKIPVEIISQIRQQLTYVCFFFFLFIYLFRFQRKRFIPREEVRTELSPESMMVITHKMNSNHLI